MAQKQSGKSKRQMWLSILSMKRQGGSPPSKVLIGIVLIIFVSLIGGVIGAWLLGLFANQAKAPLTLAIVTTNSGPREEVKKGKEALNSVQLYIDAVNQTGGVNGHPLQLRVFDDKFDPGTAKEVAQQVVDSSSLMVLGPTFSAVALDPNPIYREAHLPLITGTVSTDKLTEENPYAFRLRTDSTSQGKMAAAYTRQILGLNTASVVHTDDKAYGVASAKIFADEFGSQGGNVTQPIALSQDPTPDQLDKMVLTLLAQNPNPGIVYVAALEGPTHKVIVALRRHGVTAPILCTSASGYDRFIELFYPDAKEQNKPIEYFLKDVYAPAPMIFDSAPDKAQAFAGLYQKTYGGLPSWYGAKFYESAQVAVEALKKANVQGISGSLKRDREQIKNELAAINSPQRSVDVLSGLVYFDNKNNAVSPFRFGQFLHGRLRSLPIQLMGVNNLSPDELAKQKTAGEIIQLGDEHFWKQKVIYAGIDINQISSVNMAESKFTADFYLWMRYRDTDAAADITFPNAITVSFDPQSPLESRIIDGLNYRLYHVTGDFKANYDFHDYPFDQQQLRIGFQNTRIRSDRLVYAIDAEGLRLRADNTLDLRLVTTAFQSLSSWKYLSTQYASNTFTSTTTRGDPSLFGLQTRTDFSGLQATTIIQRKSLAYLTSHVLPLALLFILVYASLFLPIERLGDHLVLVVTALLASAVLLLSINSELPEIGYGVSLHNIYYVFFLLCLLCIIVPMIMERLEKRGQKRIVFGIQLGLHVIYLLVVIFMIAWYLVIYGSTLV